MRSTLSYTKSFFPRNGRSRIGFLPPSPFDFPHGKFHTGFPRRFFDRCSINDLAEILVSHPRTGRTAITVPNVKTYAPLAQLCNVPRARQRIVSVPYLAWDSPRLWPASGHAKLWIDRFYWISWSQRPKLCFDVTKLDACFFFSRFRKWIWRGSSLIGFFLWLIPLKWNKETNLFRIANKKATFFFYLFWNFLNISFEILKFFPFEK